MSYELAFWNEKNENILPKETYQKICSDTTDTLSLVQLPHLDIYNAIKAHFNTWNQLSVIEPDDLTGQADFANGEYMSFTLARQGEAYVISCRGLDNDSMNAFIDIFDKFDCPLYDPQTDERFA